MTENSVLFQKGFSLADFMQYYGTEAQCANALFKAAGPRVSDAIECWAGKHLAPGGLVYSDGLACFSAVITTTSSLAAGRRA